MGHFSSAWLIPRENGPSRPFSGSSPGRMAHANLFQAISREDGPSRPFLAHSSEGWRVPAFFAPFPGRMAHPNLFPAHAPGEWAIFLWYGSFLGRLAPFFSCTARIREDAPFSPYWKGPHLGAGVPARNSSSTRRNASGSS